LGTPTQRKPPHQDGHRDVYRLPSIQDRLHEVRCQQGQSHDAADSSPGQAVYEPFCGSGTTIVAAEMTGRACYAIELLGEYLDVTVERWQAFTGKSATLDGDGRSFVAVAAERQPRPDA
jgi:hypothetical protein